MVLAKAGNGSGIDTGVKLSEFALNEFAAAN